jgi:two-component system OmpR family sensor kinase
MRLIPDTIAGRTVSVLLLGLTALHLASIWAYQIGLHSEVNLTNAARTAERLVAIGSTLNQLPHADREAAAHTLSGGAFEVHYSSVPLAVAPAVLEGPPSDLRAELFKLVDRVTEDEVIVGAPTDRSGMRTDPHLTLVSIKLADGGWANTNIAQLEGPHSSIGAILVSTSLMALGVLGIALGMSRSVTQPIRKCAEEAQRVYAAREPQPLLVEGPKEVRELATAFNEMQQRVKKLVDERTLVLAAVSHDLKSPLARLRLRIEELESDDRRRGLESDLDEMLQMIDSALEFLRGDHTGEEKQRLDIGAIIGTICDNFADRDFTAMVVRQDKAVFRGRRLALKRAFTNLIDNAIKYGQSAQVSVVATDQNVTIIIEDEGPGIPEQELDKVYAPFYRLETSRSRDTGGSGLGLTVAHSVITSHGGSLRLANRPERGLAATIVLPRH